MEHENEMEIGENEIFIGMKKDALHTYQSASKTEKLEKVKDDNLSLLTSTSPSVTPTNNRKLIKTPSPSGPRTSPVIETLPISRPLTKDVSGSSSSGFPIIAETTEISISDGRKITTENTIAHNASTMMIGDSVNPVSNSTLSESASVRNTVAAGAPPLEIISPIINNSNNVKNESNSTEDNKNNKNNISNMKKKRKRRRGKPKTNNTKPYKKSNWKFQMPRYRNNDNNKNSNTVGGGGGHAGRIRGKLVRSRSIAPYNTNRFLMEEHMAEVPSALLTPSGRTRDSSFSVDSEDNYFYSLPEDEEEFLTKEFSNVYERARVERLESMSKQQLIEECLQLEDRYAQMSGIQQQQNTSVEFLNRIRALEERIRELSSENYDIRRKLDQTQGNLPQNVERMCSSSSSEDSESDSSSTSRSSCDSSEYSGCSRRSSLVNEPSDINDSKMDSDENNLMNVPINGSYNGEIYENTNGTNERNGNSNVTDGILCNGGDMIGNGSESKESSPALGDSSVASQNISLG